MKLENVTKLTRDNLQTKTSVNRSCNNNVSEYGIIDAHQPVQFQKSYMQNDDFLSRNCYGGGKRKSNDSDVDYDPDDAKKNKRKKKKRKYNRKSNLKNNAKRAKGEARSSQRIDAVKAVNSKTNPKNKPKRPRK